MSTYITTWQCVKCGAIVTTKQPNAGFWHGYGIRQLADGPCPKGGDHDWHELTQGKWVDDDKD